MAQHVILRTQAVCLCMLSNRLAPLSARWTEYNELYLRLFERR